MHTFRGVIINLIQEYVTKADGAVYPIQVDKGNLEIWGKDMETAEWMAVFLGYKFVDVGLIQEREIWLKPEKWFLFKTN